MVNLKKLIFVLVMILLAGCGQDGKLSGVDKTQTGNVDSEDKIEIVFSIEGPSDRGSIFKEKKVEVVKGDTVLDVLVQVTEKHKLALDYRGSGATAYVSGIDNIYEFDYGAKSGWVGKLNGEDLVKSSDVVKVQAGDKVQWLYTEK